MTSVAVSTDVDASPLVEHFDEVSTSVRPERLPFNVAALVFIRNRGIIVLWLMLVAVFSVWASPYFFTKNNFLLILSAAALTAIFAMAVTFSVVAGALDLSVPAVAALAGVSLGKIVSAGHPIWLGLVVGVAVGIAAGLVNGLITLLGGFNPLIVTIGTLGALGGAAAMLANGYTISGLYDLEFMGTRRYHDVAAPVYIVAVLYALGTFFLTKTRAGIRMMAVGGNPEAVRRVGLNSRQYQLLGFVLSGACAAIGGIVTAAVITEANPQVSPSIIFEALTAVALAGVSLAGGRGQLPKVLVGALVLATISDGLTIVGVAPYWARVVTGALLILALVFDKVLSRVISDRLIHIGDLSAHAQVRS